MGGVSGPSVLLGEVVHIPWLSPSTFNTIINTLFLVLGFIFQQGLGFKTVYCSLLYAGLIQVFEVLIPLSQPLTSNKMLGGLLLPSSSCPPWARASSSISTPPPAAPTSPP